MDPLEQLSRDLETVTEEEVAAVIAHTNPLASGSEAKLLGEIREPTTRRLLALASRYRTESLRAALEYELANVDKLIRLDIPSNVSRLKLLADLCRDLAWFRVKDEVNLWAYDGQLKLYPNWTVYHEVAQENAVESLINKVLSALAQNQPSEDDEDPPPSVQ